MLNGVIGEQCVTATLGVIDVKGAVANQAVERRTKEPELTPPLTIAESLLLEMAHRRR